MSGKISKAITPKNASLKGDIRLGDKVRLKLEKGDMDKWFGPRWSNKEYQVYQENKPKVPGKPNTYLVEDEKKRYTEVYYKEDLQVIPRQALITNNVADVSNKFTISKIHKPARKKVGANQWVNSLLIQWKHFRKKVDWTWENDTQIRESTPKMYKAFVDKWVEDHPDKSLDGKIDYTKVEKIN